MLNRLTIRTRLVATMAILGAIILAVGLMGIWGIRTVNATLEDTYTNQMASTVAIAQTKIFIARARFAQDRAVFHPDSDEVPALIKRADGFVAKSSENLQRYLALPQEAEEKALADDMVAKHKLLVEQGLNGMSKALLDHDAAAIDRFAMKEMTKYFNSFNEAAEKLEKYQFDSAEEGFGSSQAMYKRVLNLSIAAVVIGLALIVVGSITLVRAIMRPLHDVLGHFDAMAAGDLSNPVDTDRHDEMGQLLKGLDRMQQQLAGTVRTVREGSGAIAVASAEIADGNMDLSRRTEQQAASLEETASSLEELTATVRQNADNARQANTMVVSASEVAQQGGQIVSQVVDTMGAITASSKQIVDIISVIDGIAFQTNILALNAAVEAARAGEQGRGFAVVASEVRNLAQRSGAAAKEIKQLIDNSVSSVNAGSALVGQAGTTMDEIVGSVKRVQDIMGEIMAASTEQSAGIDLINDAVTQMDQVTQQNAALVEEAAAAAGSLQEQAATLEQTVSVFRLQQQNARPALGQTRAAAKLALQA
ncbi:methyl-accepting chemotaxis sensory transducer with TarH sensor [Pseudoduganella lurida]|uniref:Methyl-accepting chemotaxis sensory transducer with TarH sensor n=1 Tax=Pseudoduganella lurida TaxID=1036180 RepID=A0A562RBQ6_9BURK|nr:methyl-accepting chemotaxis protein [Pseudoduganella lurida]TWI66492.1 methyl-accepting chemotaxis sensory transducer with TarH sensor [Pseudoduganella lurida]